MSAEVQLPLYLKEDHHASLGLESGFVYRLDYVGKIASSKLFSTLQHCLYYPVYSSDQDVKSRRYRVLQFILGKHVKDSPLPSLRKNSCFWRIMS